MLINYWDIAIEASVGYGQYLMRDILNPTWGSYFYWLIGLSVLVWSVEIIIPWRKGQAIVRKDFWLDGFYMFFNFFIFSLIGYNAASMVGVALFSDFIGWFGLENIVALEIGTWPRWLQLLTMFVVADFIHFNIHRLLHKVPMLWEFHKLHHSVKEMGFAAHLRFHWMESVMYKSIQYIPLAMIGFGISDFFLIHIFAITIGHLNHSNINMNYGPLKYIINNPKMHIWHHAKKGLQEHPTGINFGISLSIWDYIFKTAHVPKDGRDLELGFEEDDKYPTSFLKQIIYPIFKNK
ncbi:MAG: sterol desaturase family protein [Flavobacteriales bacterium]|nr:sterol desaturase family protein [Flavobacteriales bacterium]